MAPKNLKMNDLVWAKMKYYPHWPGRIVPPPVDKKIKLQKKQFCVFFFASNNYGVVPEKSIERHSDEMVKKSTEKKYKFKLFQEAVQVMVQEYAKLLALMEKATPTNLISEKKIIKNTYGINACPYKVDGAENEGNGKKRRKKRCKCKPVLVDLEEEPDDVSNYIGDYYVMYDIKVEAEEEEARIKAGKRPRKKKVPLAVIDPNVVIKKGRSKENAAKKSKTRKKKAQDKASSKSTKSVKKLTKTGRTAKPKRKPVKTKGKPAKVSKRPTKINKQPAKVNKKPSKTNEKTATVNKKSTEVTMSKQLEAAMPPLKTKNVTIDDFLGWIRDGIWNPYAIP